MKYSQRCDCLLDWEYFALVLDISVPKATVDTVLQKKNKSVKANHTTVKIIIISALKPINSL